jgi:hypothetical protein
MDTWVVAWLLIAILSTIAATALLAGLVRHVLLVGRTAREFREAVKPMTEEISRQTSRASERASRARTSRLTGPS